MVGTRVSCGILERGMAACQLEDGARRFKLLKINYPQVHIVLIIDLSRKSQSKLQDVLRGAHGTSRER